MKFNMIWIYDRDLSHIASVLNGSTNKYDLDRGTLGLSTLSRWKANIDELDNLLNQKSIKIDHAAVPVVSGNVLMRAPNPTQPIKVTMSNGSVEEKIPDVSYNPVYYYIKAFRDIISYAGLSLEGIPTDAEYLNWEKLNTMENVAEQAFIIIQNQSEKGLLKYSGKIISGGYII